MTNTLLVDNKISELRDAFNRTYAIPAASQAAQQMENLLSIRVAGRPYAIKVSEISGLVNDRKTVALPSRVPELLGVAGIRGGLVSVYSLAMLLGYSQDVGQVRWLALCGSDEPVGLAISDFDGYVRVPLTRLYTAEKKDQTWTHAGHLLRVDDVVRAVVSIPYLLETIMKRGNENRVSKEQ